MSYRGAPNRGRGRSSGPVPPIGNSFTPSKTTVNPVISAVAPVAATPSFVNIPVPVPSAVPLPVVLTNPKTEIAPEIPMPVSTDVQMEGVVEKPSWMKKRSREEEKDNRVAKRKRKNAQVVKAAHPKTAVSALTEIAIQMNLPAPVYENFHSVGEKPSDGFYIDVVFQDVRHKGYGSNQSKAKQAACELHIRDLIRANFTKLAPTPGKKPDEDTEMSEAEEGAKRPRMEEDPTPWGAIYAFVMRKYLDLMEMGDAPLSVASAGGIPPMPAFGGMPYRMPYQAAYATADMPMPGPNDFINYSMFSGGYPGGQMRPKHEAGLVMNKMRPGPKIPTGLKPTAAKKLPENAVSMNPVALLNQMRPDAVYSTHSDTGLGDNRFILKVTIDEEAYEGAGPKVKEAKKQAAKRAVLAIYGIECCGL